MTRLFGLGLDGPPGGGLQLSFIFERSVSENFPLYVNDNQNIRPTVPVSGRGGGLEPAAICGLGLIGFGGDFGGDAFTLGLAVTLVIFPPLSRLNIFLDHTFGSNATDKL